MGFDIPDDWRFMRVKEEIERGRLWKARDRLQGRLADEPANQLILALLGDVCFAMGDLPQAGRYWWLTERDDDRAREARDAFTERFGGKAMGILRALPKPTRPEHYPDAVRIRFEALVTAARDDGIEWQPAHRMAAPVEPEGDVVAHRLSWIDRAAYDDRIGALMALAILVLAIIGAGTVTIQVVQFLT